VPSVELCVGGDVKLLFRERCKYIILLQLHYDILRIFISTFSTAWAVYWRNGFGNKQCSCLVSAAMQSSSMLPVARAACQFHIRVETLTMYSTGWQIATRVYGVTSQNALFLVDCESVRSNELRHWQCCTVSRSVSVSVRP
jgi:hypothetical protein